MRFIPILAAGLLVVPMTLHGQRSPEAKQLEIKLPVPQAAAVTRVQTAYVAEGLSITSTAGGVIVGSDNDGPLQLRYSATVLAVDSASSRVVLTAFGTRPQVGIVPAATAQVTSRTGGPGKKVWQRLERLHAALAADTAQSPPLTLR